MKTLIIPTVGISNVPQLVVQQLISWNEVSYIKKLDPTYLYPYVATGALITHTPLELHQMSNEDVGIIQLHSPVLPGYEYQFAHQIQQVAKDECIERVIVIDSKDRGETIGWEWFSSDSSLEKIMTSLSLSEDEIKQIPRDKTCSLVKLINDIPIDYYSVRVYEGPNEIAINQMAQLVAQREGLVIGK